MRVDPTRGARRVSRRETLANVAVWLSLILAMVTTLCLMAVVLAMIGYTLGLPLPTVPGDACPADGGP